MAKKDSKNGMGVLFGISFISPITFSIVVYEMDVFQRVFFFAVSILLFLVYVGKVKKMEDVYLDKPLSMLIVIFPVTFLTCFINGSSSLLILQLTDLIIPFSILLQSALIFVILGEEKFLRVVSYSVVTVSTLFSIIGILEVFQIKIIDLPSIIPPGSTLGHRSFAAEYLLPSIPFLLIVKQYLPKEKSVLFFIISVINISFLLFTRNRSGLIILCVIVILYFIFIINKKEKQNKIKKIIIISGMESMNRNPKSPKIFGLVTHQSLEELLYKNGISKFLAGSIYGTDAAMITAFRKSKTPALILYAECHPFFPDPEASIIAITTLAKVLDVKVNTTDIQKKIEWLRIQHRNLMEETIRSLQLQNQEKSQGRVPQIYR